MSRNQRRNKRNKSGGSQAARTPQRRDTEVSTVTEVVRRSSTETKSSLKTTELIAYAGAVLAVVMTALAVDEDRQGNDPFGAESAIRYITFLTIGYMVARGLAKSGSYENRVEHDSDPADDGAVRTFVGDDEITRDDDRDPRGAVDDDDDHRGGDRRTGDVDLADTRAVDTRAVDTRVVDTDAVETRVVDTDVVDTGVPGEDVQRAARTVSSADARP